MTVEVHQSQIKLARRCWNAHYYRYVEEIEKKVTPKPLTRGTIAHVMMEYHYSDEDPWAYLDRVEKVYGKQFQAHIEEYGDIIDEVRAIMSGYFKYYRKEPLKFIEIDGKRAEHNLVVPLAPGIKYSCKIDAITETQDGLRWLTDHKTHGVIPEGDTPIFNLQPYMYSWALLESGTLSKLDGICWNYIRWKPPVVPDVLKNGDLTRRKNIDTTWSVYRQAIKDNDLKVSDYRDMKELLRGKEDSFYLRKFLPLNDHIMRTLVNEAVVTAEEILEHGKTKRVRTIDRHCDWCQYNTLCRAELLGKDSKWVRANGFQSIEEGKKKRARAEGKRLSVRDQKNKRRRRI